VSDAIPPLPAEDHHCPSCGVDYAALPIVEATATITALPADAAAAVAGLDAIRLRVRPEPGTWSAVEYLCHLRDVAVTATVRLHRARTEDRPVLEPMLNDLRARRFRYVDADPLAVLAELRRVVGGVSDEIARISADGWTRTVTRLPGEERTVRWLVRHAAHECRHHLADIRRVIA
jgi:DinB superfamily